MLINTSNNPITTVMTLLAAIGAVNWGLVGALNFNLVSFLFGEFSSITKIVYILVGIAGVYLLLTVTKIISSPSIKDIK
ncbi:MAG: DUF378 domain-containing protein [Rickettsiaceae bacterium]|nr:MAG: DUF378 domain-containing protein [Rickettsiaceae bacterium]